ncbi:MAG: hypothetical protein AAFX99_00860 [Myxococcota bacterium]
MDAETCGHHGWDLLKGHGVPRNVERARLLLDDACAQGFETACVYLHGTVTPGSPEEGHMLGHLCQHNVYACSQLARRLPVFAQVPSDALSAEVLGQACKAGNAVACNNLGAHLVHSSDPSGVRMGLRLFRDACAQCEPVGCINLGATFDWHGWGAQTKGGRIGGLDIAMATGYYRRACSMGNQLGCFLVSAHDPDAASEPSHEAQPKKKEEDPLLWTDPERPPPPNAQKDLELKEKALAQAEQWLDDFDADPSKAVQALDRGCTYGHRRSCRVLGRRFALGQGVVPNLSRASALLRRACNLDDAPACLLRARFRCLEEGFKFSACDAPALFYAQRAAQLEQGDPESLDIVARIACVMGLRNQADEAWQQAGIARVCR